MSIATGNAVAAIDCGSNSFRLMIRLSDGSIIRKSVVCGLSRGYGATGLIAQDALERGRVVLVEFAEMLKTHRIERVRVTATEAVRKATNASEFATLVTQALGHDLEILTSGQEGALSFRGAIAGLGIDEAHRASTRAASTFGVGPFFEVGATDTPLDVRDDVYLTIDIGGASTELAAGTADQQTPAVYSIPLGGVVATELYLPSDPPLPEDLSNLFGVMHSHIEDALREAPSIAQAGHLVAVGGTACVIGAVERGVDWGTGDATSGLVLTRDEIESVFRMLAFDTVEDRAQNPGLPADRAEVVVAGCVLLLSVMRRFGFADVVISEHDLLDALVTELASEPTA
jgi:exopolyphosphatase/guanosine-5'-triphosphate,3'-diphosphate pyrophosphatase